MAVFGLLFEIMKKSNILSPSFSTIPLSTSVPGAGLITFPLTFSNNLVEIFLSTKT